MAQWHYLHSPATLLCGGAALGRYPCGPALAAEFGAVAHAGTDGRTLYRFIDLAADTIRAVPIIRNNDMDVSAGVYSEMLIILCIYSFPLVVGLCNIL